MSYHGMRETRKRRQLGKTFGIVAAIACVAVLTSAGVAQAGVLFSSSWDSATGYSSTAINDGGKWNSGYNTPPLQYPYVSAGGPGGHNFLNMVTVGGGGIGNRYYMNWWTTGGNGGDVLGDPDNLYLRVYFRVHQGEVNNLHNNNHWFMGYDTLNSDSRDGKHYLLFANTPGEFTNFSSPFVIAVQDYSDNVQFRAKVPMQAERWYCFEVHVQKIDSSRERRYMRLDGVDITDKFLCTSGSQYGKWLGDLYTQGWSWVNEYHGALWMNTYDESTVNDGWDVALVEARNDTWPGLISGTPQTPPDDTTAPTGTVQVTGTEGMAERTGSPAVTLSLNAIDSGSGMGSGAQMQFSNDGTTWSSPEPYQTTKAWNLPDVTAGTEQSRTVYAKFKDVAGNWSNPVNDSIILDRKPPAAPSGITISN